MTTDRPVFPDGLDLNNCKGCPRVCGADRTSEQLGYCNSSDAVMISSVCAHRGEEPVISGKSGVCNVFFAHCNLQCVYCQNYQISRNHTSNHALKGVDQVIAEIEQVLDQGARGIGFVSPSHYINGMLQIIDSLKKRGHNQRFIFNSNGYDRVKIVRSLAGVIDVYLPDLKYMDEQIGREYSDAPRYPQIATAAIREMFYQKGTNLILDDDGVIESGLIIRHLVLPGHVENSKAVLRWIADELSPSVHISLMSQYYPTPAVRDHPVLGRTLNIDEYEEVIEEFESLGFYRGWVQELDSSHSYKPDFDNSHPFEEGGQSI
ncbi:MAG: radical SAM protein [candidate division Zixibacteria bacterium]|nr:radical SAM protein [candidate division Zixibacteria bacterium]